MQHYRYFKATYGKKMNSFSFFNGVYRNRGILHAISPPPPRFLKNSCGVRERTGRWTLAAIAMALASAFAPSAQGQSESIALTATAGVERFDLSWTLVGSYVSSTTIVHDDGSGPVVISQDSGNTYGTSTVEDTPIASGWGKPIEIYVFKQIAGSSTRAQSNTETIVPLPRKVSGLSVEAGSSENTELTLNWNEVDRGPADKSYQYRQSVDGGNTWNPEWTDMSGATSTYTVTGLSPGIEYTFQVRVRGGDVQSAPSGPASASTVALTGVPSGLTVEATGDGARLIWTAASGTVEKYQYRYRPSAGTDTE